MVDELPLWFWLPLAVILWSYLLLVWTAPARREPRRNRA